MKIEAIPVFPLDTNCYFIWDEDSKRLAIVDPGNYTNKVIDKINSENLKPEAILLTHGHFDHIMGVPGLLEDHPDIKIYASAEELEVLQDPSINMSGKFKKKPVTITPDVLLRDGESFNVCGFDMKFLLTPGHTGGSGCFYLENQDVLFSGDTLFKGSYGRYDFPTGSYDAIKSSLKRLMELPDDVVVLPGHGGSTTIGNERYWA